MKGKKLSVAIFLIALMVFPQFALARDGQIAGDKEIQLRVATYNIAAGRGVDGSYDLERIAEAVGEMDADIIGLQEVDVHWGTRSENDNMIEKLAQRLEMHYYFAPIYDMDPLAEGEPRRQYGVGLLSRYPITEAANREITRLSTQDPNPAPSLTPGFLQAKINARGADIWFYVTHLDYRADPSIREMQIEDMQRIMSEHSYSILVGDMNAQPNAPELQPLFTDYLDTWSMNNEHPGHTFPADAPDRRIDYILASPRMGVESAETQPSAASDHLAVLADITVHTEERSLSLTGTSWLIAFYEQRGDIAGDGLVKVLKRQMEALGYYEEQGNADKLVKHLRGFMELIDHQKQIGRLSEEAWMDLRADAEHFIRGWEARH